MDGVTTALPEQALVRRVRRAANLNRELKAAQRMSGASGQLSYEIATTNTWDLTQALPNKTSQTLLTFEVTVTTDGTQQWPEVRLYLDVRAGGTGPSNKFTYLNGSYAGYLFAAKLGWSSGGNLMTTGSQTRTMTGNQHKWIVNLYYQGSFTYYLKATARASCGGTISVVRTA